MADYVPFTIQAYTNPNNNPEYTYTNKNILLKTPANMAPFELPSMKNFAKTVGEVLGFENFLLQQTPIQRISLTDTASSVIVYKQEYVFDDNYDMLTKIYRDGDLRVTINRGNYYDTPRKNFTIPEITLEINSGVYEIEYLFFDEWDRFYYKATGIIAAVQNKYPLKKWTVTDVVNRCLELAEPLKIGQNPRFTFDGASYTNGIVNTYTVGSQAEKYDKVLAPEFAMAKQTLREQLKQVGGFIHGEPRLKNGVIRFDEYGKGKISNISLKKPISTQLRQDINEYCTELDSQADNLVNRLDWAQGVIIEPFNGGYQSVRNETITVRIGEDNGMIATQRPIYEIKEVKCKYATSVSNGQPTAWSEPIDITAYLFENAEYRNLSSFAGVFPFSKEYALEYTQGSNNITGLFFKPPDITDKAVTNYSIVKILETEGVPKSKITDNNYAILSFNVSYIPIFSERVKTNKSLIIGNKKRALVYNQSANLVETRYYGENLKGVVARLGNVEKTLTYKVAFLSDIPKSGDMFDDEYYISTVAVDYQPFYIKVTVGLSKDFNRLSQYVGISSNQRMYVVSEKQAQDRDSVYVNYLEIKDANDSPSANPYTGFFSYQFLIRLAMMFNEQEESQDYAQVNQALIRGRNYNQDLVRDNYAISLPVVSSALGNNLTFSCNFEDNYSAGQKSLYNTGDVSGYFSSYVPYSDYYGRFYWLEFAFYSKLNLQSDPLELPQIDYTANALPTTTLDANYNEVTTALIESKSNYIRYRKESTETPSLTFQLSIVTKNKDFIIGSAFARNCSLVTGKPLTERLKLYVFSERLNAYDEFLDFSQATDLGYVTTSVVSNTLRIAAINPSTVNGKAWAIASPVHSETITVEDETGREIPQIIQTGGELFIGKNVEILAGQEIEGPAFLLREKIYED